MTVDTAPMPCRVCGTMADFRFRTRVLAKYDVAYYQCPRCHFVQTEAPYWLEEAYASPINYTDTGIIARNLTLAEPTLTLLYFLFGPQHRYLDYAGGYGLFTRMMRDAGLDYYWSDPYTQNLVARGFEYQPGMAIQALTAFETFEHLADPLPEIRKMVAIAPNLIFSTQLVPDPLPAPDDWWYYAREHGQHVALYAPQTLRYVAAELGMHYVHFNNFHLLTTEPIAPWRFRALYVAGKLGLGRALRLRLRSRTQADMQAMIRQLNP